jgi:hypothetical protein
MHGSDNARPGGSPGAGASSRWVDSHQLTPDRETRQQADRIHALGRKGLSYFLHEIERDPANIRAIVRRYAAAGLNPGFVEACGGRDWLELRHLVRVVRP